jgi:uncharacterized protein YegP (UPF0339 family)
VSPKNKSRGTVFISYSHKDKEWLERVQVHLKPLEQYYDIDVWDDSKIDYGDKWEEEIEKAIESAQVAILIISADFIASDFIAKRELPPLLEAAEKGGTVILLLFVSSSMYSETPLSEYQGINDPDEPLNMIENGKKEQVLTNLAQAVKDSLPSTPELERKKLKGKFEVNCNSDGKFYFYLKAANGKIILESNEYKNKLGVKNAIESIRQFARGDIRFVRQNLNGKKFFFRLKAKNGRIIGASHKYSSVNAMEYGIFLVQEMAPKAKIVDSTKTKWSPIGAHP